MSKVPTVTLGGLLLEREALKLDVKLLRAEVEDLRRQISERDGEVMALRHMLLWWPVRFPDDPPPLRH